MTAAVDGVLAAAGLPRIRVHRVVVATPGVIDPVTGHLRHARHIKGWETPGLTSLMTESLGIPVSQGNDVNLAAVAEGLLGAAGTARTMRCSGWTAASGWASCWTERCAPAPTAAPVRSATCRCPASITPGWTAALPVASSSSSAARGCARWPAGTASAAAEPAAIVTAALAAGDAGRGVPVRTGRRDRLGATAVTTLLDPGLLVLGGPVALAGGTRLLDKVVAQMRQASFVRPQVVLSTVRRQRCPARRDRGRAADGPAHNCSATTDLGGSDRPLVAVGSELPFSRPGSGTPPGPLAVRASSAAAMTARRSPPTCAAIAADTAPSTNGASTITTRSDLVRLQELHRGLRGQVPAAQVVQQHGAVTRIGLRDGGRDQVERRADGAVLQTARRGDRHRRGHLAGDVGQALAPTLDCATPGQDQRSRGSLFAAGDQALAAAARACSRYPVLVAPGSGCPIDRSPR